MLGIEIETVRGGGKEDSIARGGPSLEDPAMEQEDEQEQCQYWCPIERSREQTAAAKPNSQALGNRCSVSWPRCLTVIWSIGSANKTILSCR